MVDRNDDERLLIVRFPNIGPITSSLRFGVARILDSASLYRFFDRRIICPGNGVRCGGGRITSGVPCGGGWITSGVPCGGGWITSGVHLGSRSDSRSDGRVAQILVADRCRAVDGTQIDFRFDVDLTTDNTPPHRIGIRRAGGVEHLLLGSAVERSEASLPHRFERSQQRRVVTSTVPEPHGDGDQQQTEQGECTSEEVHLAGAVGVVDGIGEHAHKTVG